MKITRTDKGFIAEYEGGAVERTECVFCRSGEARP